MIEVKMRDVPWSEVTNHFRSEPSNAEHLWETQMRGKTVRLTGHKLKYKFLQKDGTPLEVVGHETDLIVDCNQHGKESFWACSVCAEIGD